MSPLARPGPMDLDAGRRSRDDQVGPQRPRRRRSSRTSRTVGCSWSAGWTSRRSPRRSGPGDVHFHSRSRGRLWRKGETSGNVLKLRELALDCDGDALLIGAEPLGPTCHRETRSCFDPDAISRAVPGFEQDPEAAPGPGSDPVELPDANDAWQGFAWLEHLWATIAEREAPPARGLVHGPAPRRRRRRRRAQGHRGGDRGAARRQERRGGRDTPGTDRVELRELLAGEAADLVYHALVLLAERGLEPREVVRLLRVRHGGRRTS